MLTSCVRATIATLALAAGAAGLHATAQAPIPEVIAPTRSQIAAGDFAAADATVRSFVAAQGWTPEALEALSWLSRGSLAASRLEPAIRYAYETERLALDALETRPLDQESHLPIALGAAIEVQAQVLARQGDLGTALRLLERNLDRFRTTSIRTRLQKNLHVLSLEGKPAPAYAIDEHVGPAPPTIAELKGRAVILFFWAHWCPDCKATAPVLAALQQKYRDQGLVIVGPTQRYGYVAGREPADAQTELRYMGSVQGEFYRDIDMTVPVSNDSFAGYGASTTPTLVLVDRDGIVRLYHPGRMTLEELEPHVRALLGLS